MTKDGNRTKETIKKLNQLDEKSLAAVDSAITVLIMRQQLEENKKTKEKVGV